MTLHITPEIGISAEIPSNSNYLDLRERAEAACNTATMLAEHGLNIEADELDKDVAAVLATSYANDMELASKSVSDARTSTLTPACLVMTHQILDDFGHLVARHSAEIRYMVTNKLINETENADARIRIRALELLGKMTDVGLFTDRKEITVNHTSPADIKAQLRKKLELLKQGDDGVYDVEVEVVDTDA